jgi:hypothetical protein
VGGQLLLDNRITMNVGVNIYQYGQLREIVLGQKISNKHCCIVAQLNMPFCHNLTFKVELWCFSATFLYS